jgi:hypothetical protein
VTPATLPMPVRRALAFVTQPHAVMAVLILCMIAAVGAGIYSNVSSPFEHDELFTGGMACQPAVSETLRLIEWDMHPVLYIVSIHYLFQMFGCHLWLVRGLSMICSLAGSALLLWRTRALGGDTLAVLAVLAASPAFWFNSFEARDYAILYLATSGIIFFSLSPNPGRRLYALAFAMLGAALNYFALYMFVVATVLAWVNDRSFCLSRRFLIAWAVSLLSVTAYYSFQIENAYQTSKSVEWSGTNSLIMPVLFVLEYFFGTTASIGILATALIMTPGLFGDRRMTRIAVTLALSLAALILIFDVASLHRPIFAVRYVYFLFPVVVMPIGLLNATGKRSGKPFNRQTAGFLILFLLFNTIAMTTIYANLRIGMWGRALNDMVCSAQHPCAFAVSSDFRYTPTDEQFQDMVNFARKAPDTFTLLRTPALSGWMARNPDGQFAWLSGPAMGSNSEERQAVDALARQHSLTCKTFTSSGFTSLTCPIDTLGGRL